MFIERTLKQWFCDNNQLFYLMEMFKTTWLCYKFFFNIQVRNSAILVTKKLHERDDMKDPIEVRNGGFLYGVEGPVCNFQFLLDLCLYEISVKNWSNFDPVYY